LILIEPWSAVLDAAATIDTEVVRQYLTHYKSHALQIKVAGLRTQG